MPARERRMEADLRLLERRYQQLTATIRAWGEAESEVLAMLLGSRAGKGSDVWSDLDLTIISRSPDRFLRFNDWLKEIDDVWVTSIDRTEVGASLERHVVFAGGIDASLVLTDPFGRGGVREHLRERTRTGGTEPARHPPPEAVLASAGRDGAVRPPWIPRNRPRAALAGALTRSAAAYEADARSLPPTVVTRPGGSISRGGSAPQ